jgi:hypothetical protein
MSGEGHYFPYIQNKQTQRPSHYAPKGAPRGALLIRSRCKNDPGDPENRGILYRCLNQFLLARICP